MLDKLGHLKRTFKKSLLAQSIETSCRCIGVPPWHSGPAEQMNPSNRPRRISERKDGSWNTCCPLCTIPAWRAVCTTSGWMCPHTTGPQISQHAAGPCGAAEGRLSSAWRLKEGEHTFLQYNACSSSDKHAVSRPHCVKSPWSPLCKHPLCTPSWLYSDPEQEVISCPASASVFLSGGQRCRQPTFQTEGVERWRASRARCTKKTWKHVWHVIKETFVFNI